MNEAQINLELRLAAIEYVLTHIGRISLLAAGGPAGALGLAKTLRQGAAEHLKTQTLPDLDAALSDHAADELQRRVDRLLSGIEEVMEKTLSQLPPQSP